MNLKIAALISFLLLGQTVQANLARTISRFPVAYAGLMALHCGIAHQTAVKKLYNNLWVQKNYTSLPDAAPEVTEFVIKRMQKHGVPRKGLLVKMVSLPDGSFSCYKKFIFIREDKHRRLLMLLKKPNLDDQEESDFLNYCISIDHEIAHIKNQDVIKEIIGSPLISIGFHGLALGAMKVSKLSHFYFPSYYKAGLFNKNTLKGGAVLLGTGLGLHIAHKLTMNYWSRLQEQRADTFALEAIDNPKAFDARINYFKEIQHQSLKICAKVTESLIDDTAPKLELTTSDFGKFYFEIYVKTQYWLYKKETAAELQSPKHFVAWLEQKPYYRNLLEQLYDSLHPHYNQRIQLAELYAKKFKSMPLHL